MAPAINYEAEVRKVYPFRSDIDCDFYFNKVSRENLWHVDVIDYQKERCVTIGKGLFKKDAWKAAYEYLKQQGKITAPNDERSVATDPKSEL